MENRFKFEPHPIEKAINEQSRGLVAVDGLERGIKRKCLTKQQIWVPRKRIENIMVDMVDELRAREKANHSNRKKSRKRRRRRGPRVLSVRYTD